MCIYISNIYIYMCVFYLYMYMCFIYIYIYMLFIYVYMFYLYIYICFIYIYICFIYLFIYLCVCLYSHSHTYIYIYLLHVPSHTRCCSRKHYSILVHDKIKDLGPKWGSWPCPNSWPLACPSSLGVATRQQLVPAETPCITKIILPMISSIWVNSTELWRLW